MAEVTELAEAPNNYRYRYASLLFHIRVDWRSGEEQRSIVKNKYLQRPHPNLGSRSAQDRGLVLAPHFFLSQKRLPGLPTWLLDFRPTISQWDVLQGMSGTIDVSGWRT